MLEAASGSDVIEGGEGKSSCDIATISSFVNDLDEAEQGGRLALYAVSCGGEMDLKIRLNRFGICNR